MSDEKTLWVQNTSKLDQNLSDLGVKVPMNKTINVYKANPYVTDAQVQKSLEDGSLGKRIEAGLVKLVPGYSNPQPHGLDHIKSATEAMKVVKTKSSVVIDTEEMDVLSDEDLGDIADYGFEPDIDFNVSREKTKDGAVVVKQRVDEDTEEQSDAVTKVEKAGYMSSQSVTVMANQRQKMSNPVGSVSEAVSPAQKSHVVTPPEPAPEPEAVESKVSNVGKDETGAVVADGKRADARSLKVIQALKEESEKRGVPVEELPESVVASIDAEMVTKFESTEFDSKVATKTDKGAVVMKLKEKAAEEE